jgi:rhodanese-related sulfurtransferase
MSLNMNFRILFLVAVLASLILVCACAGNNKNQNNLSAIETNALIEKNINNINFIILDIRTKKEFLEGHISGAINIDYYDEDFKEILIKLKKTETYLIYCRSGRRSGIVLTLFRDLGFQSVYHLKSGIKGWQSNKYPVVLD